MSITLRITDAGRAALVNASHDGTNAVRIANVGVSPLALSAGPATAVLPGEVKRINTISGTGVAADVIHVVVRDETADTYTVRSFALYLADGTLFAAYGQAAPIIEKSAAALMLLAIDATMLDVAANQITFGDANFLNPPATADTAGVVELATVAEASARVGDRALTPATAAAALLDWLGFTPVNSAGDMMHGRLIFADEIGNWSVGLRPGADLWTVRDEQFGTDTLVLDPAGNLIIGSAARPGERRFSLSNLVTDFGIVTSGSAGGGSRIVNSWVTGGQGPLVVENAAGEMARFSPTGVLQLKQVAMRAGNALWDAGNDGAGSGLDADLLDGRDGSWYSDIVGRLGFIPVRQTAGFVVEVRFSDGQLKARVNLDNDLGAFVFGGDIADVWRASNDGAGSGLDADLLDGRDGPWYADITTRLGYSPINRAGDTMSGRLRFADAQGLWSVGLRTGANLWTVRDEQFGTDTLVLDPAGNLIIGSASRPGERRFSLSNLVTDFGIVTSGSAGGGTRIVNSWVTGGQGPLVLENAAGEMARFTPAGALQLKQAATRAGNMLWDAGNDGAGSGLDADMLDGLDSTAFMQKSGGAFTGPITLKSVTFGGNAGNYTLSIPDGTDQVLLRDNQFGRDVASLSRASLTLGDGVALKRANSGRFVHYKDDLPGDTITRSTATPAGGSDGDIHYEINTAAGTMRFWHNYGGTWVHT